jgi:SAM-dependent methyltransferase
MSYLDPARPPEERIQDAITHGPDLEARGRFGGLSRFGRKLVGRAVKYERDFSMQIDVALLQRLHEIEAAAEQRTDALEAWARRAIEELRASVHRREVDEHTLRRLEHDLTLHTARIDASVAEIESTLHDTDARAAVANSIAVGAMDSIESVNRVTGELVEKTQFAYDELTALPYTADDDALHYTDSRGRLQLGYRDGSDAPVFAGFADLFRGPEALVRDRQRPYLEVIGRRGPVVDLGCGRGEMLHLLAEAGIEATGVDLDEAMVDRARVFGDVHHGDAIDFLIKQDDSSLGAIFSAQFIEHLPTTRLPELLDVARAKLRPDGVFIAETVNPHSPRALKVFWIDPTHRHPLFPETMLALCRLAGFGAARVMFPLGSDELATDLRRCGEYAVVAGSRLDD